MGYVADSSVMVVSRMMSIIRPKLFKHKNSTTNNITHKTKQAHKFTVFKIYKYCKYSRTQHN
jgi:hypothetical protein